MSTNISSRKITKFDWGGLLTGSLPTGCEQCLQGAKLVLFVTGKCGNPICGPYCPISLERRGKDVFYANERRLGKKNSAWTLKEIISEAVNAESEGASFTGGNPLLVADRVIELGKGLKRHLGDDFHLHLYAPARHLQKKRLNDLCSTIDELRLHLTSLSELSTLEQVFRMSWEVGIEVPAFPGQEDFLRGLAKWLERITSRYEKKAFLNINELEYSESNFQFFQEIGFKRKNGSIAAVAGSSITAKAIVEWASKELEQTTVHYCPSAAKDAVQLPNRLLRLARNVAEPFDIIREDGPHRGLLIRGVIRGLGPLTEQQEEILRTILHVDLEIPHEQVVWDIKKKRFLVNPIILEDLAVEIRKLGEDRSLNLQMGIIEEYPTADGLQTEFDPLP
ncbi:MAG: hypothetical protein ACE5OZ_21395 [Candidatus Heimdallarchaeota archaeon]